MTMDNQGFVVDEKLRVVRRAQGHRKECVAVYSGGKSLQRCVCMSDSEDVPVYGIMAPAPPTAQKTIAAFDIQMIEKTTKRQADSQSLNIGSGSADNVELRNVMLQFPNTWSQGAGGCVETRVRTDRGDILVAVQGDRAKPAIVTYHDIGVNYISLQTFFNYVDMRSLLRNFCVYHVNAPGQEEGAPTLPEDYVYPTMNELANQLNFVLAHFALESCIGFGVGAGANILAKFALNHPDKVGALILIDCSSTKSGWIEWSFQKLNNRTLRSSGMTQKVMEYLLLHHLGRNPDERSHDIVSTYRGYFTRQVNPTNLSMLIDAYISRPDLGIERSGETLRVPVLNITGADSAHVDDTVYFNGRLNPNKSTWMKISDCGCVLDEQPGKLSQAFRLFLQGEGYVAPLSPSKIHAFRVVSTRRACRHSPVIRITENPISEAVVC